ncbi:exosome complex protein Rrp42 [Patescibacteria group bacterium]|nr:exosome complex protein Rrp42 [Patescibacteria group bacterium]
METAKVTGERIKSYLSTGKRFDGRKQDEFRDITIETGISEKAEGSARVKIGNTEVIVGVKLSVSEPYPDSPNKGNLMVTSELLPLSSERFESGPPKFPAIELGRLIDRAIRESKFINLEKLCIKEGEKVWSVFIDIYSINYDGNLIDAAGIGAILSLKTAYLPKYDQENEKVLYGEHTDQKIPLSEELPIVITSHKIGGNIIVDPTIEEEDVSETRITIGGSVEGKLFSIQKGGIKEITVEEMDKLLEMNDNARKKVYSQIKKYL